MRAPNQDERELFFALQKEARRLGRSSRGKGDEVRSEFDLWAAGQGPGPSFDALRDWKMTLDLEQGVRHRIDALVEELFLG